ncbi:MAG: sigma-E factor negative regulatory protein [Oceanicoccus sp.]
MSDQLRESVSALMDGEADELELRRLLSTENDESVKQTWARYHLVRDVIQDNDTGAYRHLDISSQVSIAINQSGSGVGEIDQFETTVGQKTSDNVSLTDSGKHSSVSAWWRPVTGFAVAASVAMAVVVGVQTLDTNVTPGYSSGLPIASQAATTSRVYPVAGASMQASGGSGSAVRYQPTGLPGDIAASRAAADLDARDRLEKYMLRHTENAALNNGQGMISFARVASFDEK